MLEYGLTAPLMFVGLIFFMLLGFPVGMGPVGVWFGLAAGLGIVAVLMTLRWRRLSLLRPAGQPEDGFPL